MSGTPPHFPRPAGRPFLPFGPQGWLWRTPGFTAAEVRHLLTAPPAGERAQAVRRCLARAGDWLPAPDHIRCPLRYHHHLTRIVFWYTQGVPPAVIAARLSARESGWEAERALDAACASIAACLNRAPESYGLDLGLRWLPGMRAR